MFSGTKASRASQPSKPSSHGPNSVQVVVILWASTSSLISQRSPPSARHGGRGPARVENSQKMEYPPAHCTHLRSAQRCQSSFMRLIPGVGNVIDKDGGSRGWSRCDKVASRRPYLWSRTAVSPGRNTGRHANTPNSALAPAVAVRLKPRICGDLTGPDARDSLEGSADGKLKEIGSMKSFDGCYLVFPTSIDLTRS